MDMIKSIILTLSWWFVKTIVSFPGTVDNSAYITINHCGLEGRRKKFINTAQYYEWSEMVFASLFLKTFN